MAKGIQRQHDSIDRRTLQQAMSRWASVVRDADGLGGLIDVLEESESRVVSDRRGFEDAALTAAARAVATEALARTESRGCHHRADFPDTDPAQAVSQVLRIDAAVARAG